MEKKINLKDISNKLSYYYRKIYLFGILARSKKEDKWYCIKLKLILLREKDSVKINHPLYKKINENNIKVFSLEEPIERFQLIYDDLRRNKIKICNNYFDLYSIGSFSDELQQVNLKDIDTYCKEYYGYLIYGPSPKGFFSKILNEFSLTEADLAIDENVFHNFLNIPSNNVFIQHTLLVIFPIFFKEIENKTSSFSKIYYIHDKIYDKSEIRLYTNDENLEERLITQKNNDGYLIKIPYLEKYEEVNFEVYHPQFAMIENTNLIKKIFQKSQKHGHIDNELKSLIEYQSNTIKFHKPIFQTYRKPILEIIKDGENAKIEFKSSFRYDIKLGRSNPKDLEKAISKTTAAFMNSEGGILIIGVNDDGNVIGLENDYQLLHKKNSDGFQQELRQSIDKHLQDKIANEYINIHIHKQEDKEFCEVNVAPTPKPILLLDQGKYECYVRTGNLSKPYDYNEFLEYCNRHFNQRV